MPNFVHEASLEALEFGETEHETLSEVDVQQSGLEGQSEVGEPSPDSDNGGRQCPGHVR